MEHSSDDRGGLPRVRGEVTAAVIPAELREREQWVVWRWEERGGSKPTKVPYRTDAPSVHASSSVPRTWGTFGAAIAVPGVAGIGFVFSDDDPYCGVDLDDCVDSRGGVHPAAQRIIQELGSYTERSPSGTGVKIFVRAQLRRDQKHATNSTPWGGKFEVYDRGRFFTVTGVGAGEIAARQPELDTLVAEMLPGPRGGHTRQRPRPANGRAASSEWLESLRAIPSAVFVPYLTGGENLDGFVICPLHDERTPSLHVSADSAAWHCFGCHRDGGIFEFYAALTGREVPAGREFIKFADELREALS